MMEADKPFSCPVTDCGMSFVNEDHLTVHKKKHELSLTLTPSPFKHSFIDQTPTPTRFLNALDPDLFQEFPNDNPFEATFRKANSISNTSNSFIIPESSTLIANLPDSEVLNTPSVILPSEPATPVPLKQNNLNKQTSNHLNDQRNEESIDSLPFTPTLEKNQEQNPPQIQITISDVDENDIDFNQAKSIIPTTVVPTPVITSVGNSNTVTKTNATCVPTAVVVTRPITSTVSTITQSQVTTSSAVSHVKLQDPAQPVVQSVSVTPMVQLLVRLPDGQTLPVQIPIMSSTTTPTSQQEQAIAAVLPQVTSKNSLTKMKLKEVINHNQKTANAKKSNLVGKLQPKPTIQNNSTIQTIQCTQNSIETLVLNDTPPGSPTNSENSNENGRKRRRIYDDPDEKRRKSLERNRAAAIRCRNKRKQWITSLEKKAEELAVTNVHLQREVTLLRNEVTHLKTMLLAHKDCPVTLQQKVSGIADEVKESFHIITTSENSQNVPTNTISIPLNVEMLGIEVNSSQSASDASISSDVSDISFKER